MYLRHTGFGTGLRARASPRSRALQPSEVVP